MGLFYNAPEPTRGTPAYRIVPSDSHGARLTAGGCRCRCRLLALTSSASLCPWPLSASEPSDRQNENVGHSSAMYEGLVVAER